MSTAENSEQSLAENLPEEFEVKHGEVTGRELFRVRGVEMAWMPSREIAADVARHLEKADSGYFSQNR